MARTENFRVDDATFPSMSNTKRWQESRSPAAVAAVSAAALATAPAAAMGTERGNWRQFLHCWLTFGSLVPRIVGKQSWQVLAWWNGQVFAGEADYLALVWI